MLPIRWIVPIVGAFFALALMPLTFNVQDETGSLRNENIAYNEHPERRQTIVPLGIQRDGHESSGLDAVPADVTGSVEATSSPADNPVIKPIDAVPADVTGSVEATSSPANTPVIKPIARRIRHAHRTSRVTVHQRAKHAPTARIFGGQRSSRIWNTEFRFNAN